MKFKVGPGLMSPSLGDQQGCLRFPSLFHPPQLPLPRLHQTPSGEVPKHWGGGGARPPHLCLGRSLLGTPSLPSQVSSPANTWLQAHSPLGFFPELLGSSSTPFASSPPHSLPSLREAALRG